MLPGSCFSKPTLVWYEYGRWRSGLSKFTVPVFFCVVPSGNSWLSSVRFTVGPFTRNGLVGRRPADGPGSTLVADGQIGFDAGPDRIALNELHVTPAETSGLKFEYGVF